MSSGVSDTLRAFANGRKDDWDDHLPLTVFAINNAASTLGGDLTPFSSSSTAAHTLGSICRHLATTALPASRRHSMRSGYGRWNWCGSSVLAAAQAERNAKLDAGWVDTVFNSSRLATGCCCGPRS